MFAYDYSDVLSNNSGLMEIKMKVPVFDNFSLSLVYTPGVGQTCLEIQKNPQDSFKLTNRGNNMVLLTDGKLFKQQASPCCWFPELEMISVFYKKISNIDCFPLIMDSSKFKSDEEYVHFVQNLVPGYGMI